MPCSSVSSRYQRRAALRTVAGHASPEAQDHYRHVLRSEEERISAEWDLWKIQKKLTLLDAGEHPGLSAFDIDKLRPGDEKTG